MQRPRLQLWEFSDDVYSIEPMYESFMATLAAPFEGTTLDTTEQNLQARIRGVLLMSLSTSLAR